MVGKVGSGWETGFVVMDRLFWALGTSETKPTQSRLVRDVQHMG
mgnify:CR=1 FL=1|jgi:hypothetical protein